MGMAYSIGNKKKNTFNILVWKPEGKRPLGRPSHIWVKKSKAIL
jgi:hypothetical protein